MEEETGKTRKNSAAKILLKLKENGNF